MQEFRLTSMNNPNHYTHKNTNSAGIQVELYE